MGVYGLAHLSPLWICLSTRSHSCHMRAWIWPGVWQKNTRARLGRENEEEIWSSQESARVLHNIYQWPCVKIDTQILANKVMRKCHADEVLVPMILLVAQCAEGMQFNWSCYLCSEFLVNCHEDQDDNNTFHYAWLLLSIILVSWELSKDS